MGVVERGAGTGSSSAPVSARESATARDGVSVTDAKLMREALAALKHGLTLQCGTSDDAHNTYLTGDLSGEHTEDCQGCAMEEAITKLEERLLSE